MNTPLSRGRHDSSSRRPWSRREFGRFWVQLHYISIVFCPSLLKETDTVHSEVSVVPNPANNVCSGPAASPSVLITTLEFRILPSAFDTPVLSLPSLHRSRCGTGAMPTFRHEWRCDFLSHEVMCLHCGGDVCSEEGSRGSGIEVLHLFSAVIERRTGSGMPCHSAIDLHAQIGL